MTIVMILIVTFIVAVMFFAAHIRKNISKSIEILSIDEVEFGQKFLSKDDMFCLIIKHHNEQRTLFAWRLRRFLSKNAEEEKLQLRKNALLAIIDVLKNDKGCTIRLAKSTTIFLFFAPRILLPQNIRGTLEFTYQVREEINLSENNRVPTLRCRIPIKMARELSDIDNAATTLLVHFCFS